MYDVAIIGSGTAGFAAAIYCARANLATVVFTGDEFGGQIATTEDVENYPGFEDGITGPQLIARMQKQAKRFGADVKFEYIDNLDADGSPFKLSGRAGSYHARSVIVATGASPKFLGVPGEKELAGRGVSYCATCDGAFFKGVPLAIVGGGDSALQEGLFLTRFASKVTVIHRRDQLRAGALLQKRAVENPKIDFIWDTVVVEISGKEQVESLRLLNLKTGEKSDYPVSGVFVYIGHIPSTKIFRGKLEMNEEGYILADRRMHTSVEGIFVAGEAQDNYFRQAITSAGEGAMAAMEAEKFVAALGEPARQEAGAATGA